MRTSNPMCLLLFLALLSSCMKDKPEALPENLVWNPELAFPVGTDQYGMNAESGFDTTLFELDTITDLPLWVDEVEVVLGGSVEFDLSTLDPRIDSVNQVLFRLGVRNGFPNDALAQAYFLNASGIIIDSMFSDGPISVPPGIPIGEGERIDPAYVRKDAIFDQDRITPLEQATEILLRTILLNHGIDTSLVPYYPFYYIDLELGMMTDLTIEL